MEASRSSPPHPHPPRQSSHASASAGFSPLKAEPKPVLVVGGGLAGAMAALVLGRRQLPVILIEQRSDFRKSAIHEDEVGGRLANSSRRTINLTLSHRGITSLQAVGLLDKVMQHTLPMSGRAIHRAGSDKLVFQPYDKHLLSVSRAAISQVLFEALELLPNVAIRFNQRVTNVNEDGEVTLQTQNLPAEVIEARLVIGADGVYSKVREVVLRHTSSSYSRAFCDVGYKELSMPPTISGDFALKHGRSSDRLHIWPRGSLMLLAMPNPDRSMTVTMFAPVSEGTSHFGSFQTREQLEAWFKETFPDAFPLMPTLVDDWFSNPTARLATVRVSQWHVGDKLMIIGDAAHACVPFYGQGMNSAFEDCLMLDQLWDKFEGKQHLVLPELTARRQPACDALADLALEHYSEMRQQTASRIFLLKRRLEHAIARIAPWVWQPKYTLVAFTNLPYHHARDRYAKQLSWLRLISQIE